MNSIHKSVYGSHTNSQWHENNWDVFKLCWWEVHDGSTQYNIVLYYTGIPTILSFTPNYRTWIDFLVRHFYLLPGHVQVLGGRHTHYQSTIQHREWPWQLHPKTIHKETAHHNQLQTKGIKIHWSWLLQSFG